MQAIPCPWSKIHFLRMILILQTYYRKPCGFCVLSYVKVENAIQAFL